VADDDEEEEEDDYELDERGKPVNREVLDAELEEAKLLVERRHEANRVFQQASAAELAKQYEERYRNLGGYRASGSRGRGDIQESELLTNDVAKQSLIPGVNDPGIWRIKVTPGSEKQLVRSILWKTMSRQREGKPVLIKSVFCTPTAGYIYIEAIEEPLARESIAGLSGIYYSTLKRVPLSEMTTLLTITVRAKPVKEGQWCRMRRGPLKGDLVKIVRLLEGEDGGTRALIQAIPRPDYDNVTKGKAAKTTSRPLQRMFLPEDAKAKNLPVERRRGLDGEWFDFWNGDLYKHGFLYKEVRIHPNLPHS
jgi:transcription elongation factor SPT5